MFHKNAGGCSFFEEILNAKISYTSLMTSKFAPYLSFPNIPYGNQTTIQLEYKLI